ncbi:MAG: hypothetical protein SVM79_02880 [Chloroflexota bacterium]|nr:hypothetical protein [Chloroflexota bacterium]
MKRWILLTVTIFLVGITISPACGGSDASGVLEQAIEAMTHHPQFRISLDTLGIENKPSPNIEFVLPNRMRYQQGESSVSDDLLPPHMIAIGRDTYVSESGIRWKEWWGGIGAFYNPHWNPYELLRHAQEPIDEGKAILNGKQCRIIEANVDMHALAGDNALESITQIFLYPISFLSAGNDALLESLGYEVFHERVPGITGHSIHLFKPDVYIDIHPGDDKGRISAVIRNATSVSPELEQEFKDILECYGVEATAWENVRIKQDDPTSGIIEITKSMTIKAWIDEETLLPARIVVMVEPLPDASSPGRENVEYTIDITYDETITIERPEDAMHVNKAYLLRQISEQRSRVLTEILQVCREAEGRFPEKLGPEIVRDVMQTNSLEWPVNPFTGAPMKEASDSPGDYHYASTVDGSDYELTVYGWSGILSRRPIEGPPEAGKIGYPLEAE